MNRRLLLVMLFPIVLSLNACHKGGAAASPSLSVSATASAINVNGTVQFSAQIFNLSSTLVNWEVNGTAGGNLATVGSINTAGLYTAPATPPTLNTVTITAVAQADTSLTATANLTILPAAAISAITCVMAPSNTVVTTSVAAGLSLTCTPTVGGGGNNAVFWYINASSACSSTTHSTQSDDPTIVGTIFGTSQSTYTAPSVLPPGGKVTLTAVSQADSTQSFCIVLTLVYGNSSLQGSYVFSLAGTETSTNSFFARAGSFTANGNGGIIGGIEDINPQPSGITNLPPIPFVGSYTISPDGRGTMQFCEPSTSSSGVCTSPTSKFRIVVLSAQQVQVIEFDQSATAAGEMDLQDSSIFSLGASALSGTYTFGFSGSSSSAASTLQSEVGEFSANGTNGITSGAMDVNASGGPTTQTIQSSSSYSIAANGRGIATIVTSSATYHFAFYVVSAGRSKFIETDTVPILVGDAFKQQTLAPWGNNALVASMPIIFETEGSGTSAGIADLVSFVPDGTGNVLSGGTLDQNSGGTLLSVSPLGAGIYSIAANGRGTLNIPGHTYVFYMIASGAVQSVPNAVIQETTSGVVAHGSLVQQRGGPFTAASLQTSYAVSLFGANASNQEEDFVGQLTSAGTGTGLSGSLDINNFGTEQAGAAVTAGTYTSVTGNGRFTMVLNPAPLSPTRNLVLYFVSPTQVFALDTDSTDIAAGSLYKQF